MSKIEWTDVTWNPVTGCTKIAVGCKNCYAERMARRLRGRYGYSSDDPFRVTMHHDRLNQPSHWRRPKMVFVCSMGDLFHDDVALGTIRSVFTAMARCPQHIFQILTKRPGRMAHVINRWLGEGLTLREGCGAILPNVWLGTSASIQKDLDANIDHLLSTPAAVRFLSLEPLLGPINIPHTDVCHLDWVIVGGESGPGARPMHPRWVRDIRDKCIATGVSFFFKQWGEWLPGSDAMGLAISMGKSIHEFYDLCVTSNVGKNLAGRYLDGRTWDEMPR